jgi:hypothetical protein
MQGSLELGNALMSLLQHSVDVKPQVCRGKSMCHGSQHAQLTEYVDVNTMVSPVYVHLLQDALASFLLANVLVAHLVGAWTCALPE